MISAQHVRAGSYEALSPRSDFSRAACQAHLSEYWNHTLKLQETHPAHIVFVDSQSGALRRGQGSEFMPRLLKAHQAAQL